MNAKILDLSIEDYLARPELSSSGAKTILGRTPFHYWANSPMNTDPDKPEDESTKAQGIGTALHCLALEPHLFADKVAEIPFDDYRSKAAQQERDAAIALGKTPLKPAEMRLVRAMHAALMRHPFAASLMAAEGHVEKSLIWRDPETGADCRARPDKIMADMSCWIDLKTTGDAASDKMDRHAWDMGYPLQSVHQGDGIQACYGTRPGRGYLVVIEKEYPYAVAVYRFDGESEARAKLLLRRARMIYAACREQNFWPSYDGIGLIGCPAYIGRVVDDAEASGAFKPAAAKALLEAARAFQAPFGRV